MIDEWIADPTLRKFAFAIFGLVIIYVLVQILRKTTTKRLQGAESKYKVRKIISFFGYLAAIILIAGIFSDRFAQLTVAFGVAGAGIAFALQEVIASFAGWVALSFGGFYKTGDRIQLGGINGDVIDIGILRTTIMECGQWINGDLYNGRIVRIANSYVFKEPVFNYSADFPFLWDEIVLGIKFGSDYRRTRELLLEVGDKVVGEYARTAQSTWQELVEKYRIENASVIPTVTVAANENGMQFTLRYIVDYKRRRSTKDVLFSRIFEEIDRSQGRVNVITPTMDITKMPLLNVEFQQKP